MPDRITIPVPDNWHCHLREGPLLPFMVGHLIQSGFRGRVLAMPNLLDPIRTGEDAKKYEAQILGHIEIMRLSLVDQTKFSGFEPVVTIQVTEETTPDIIFAASSLGVKAAKVYPRYVTTNSEHGVVNYEKIHPALRAAAECGMVVCFHAEHPSRKVQGMMKETGFIPTLEDALSLDSRIKIVVEHVSTSGMVNWVKQVPSPYRVAATIAPQYLLLSIDDVVGYSERSGFKGEVHHLCKPVLKFWEDRESIQDVVLSSNPRFFYGGDDAPHFRKNKEAAKSNCGNFNTTVGLPKIIEFFCATGKKNLIGNFVAVYGAAFYDVPVTTETLTFENVPWVIPMEYDVPGVSPVVSGTSFPSAGTVVPMLAGEIINWKLV